MDALLRALKYREQLQIAKLAAEHLALKLEDRPRPDLVIPMPLHPHRLRERGFNQAAEIARHAARILDFQLDPDAALRVRATEPQAGLPLSKRTKNMRGAFATARDLTGKRIAVIDDVMTSGASLNELAKTLKAAGAVSVECWIAARTNKD
jgi:ComF family protein